MYVCMYVCMYRLLILNFDLAKLPLKLQETLYRCGLIFDSNRDFYSKFIHMKMWYNFM